MNATPRLAADIEAFDKDMEHKDVVAMQVWQRILREAGTKRKPTVIDEGQYHNDGWPMEWAFHPASDVTEFLRNDLRMRTHIETRYNIVLTGYDYIELDLDMLSDRRNGLGYMHSVGMSLGCSPDFQFGKQRSLQENPWVRRRPLRESGLHLHFDLRPEYIDDHTKLTYFVDSLYERLAPFHTWDHPTEEPWYRQPKCYRPKPYGIEYRSLGSSIINDPGKYALLIAEAYSLLEDHWR